jgi:DNA-binding protein YbaB
MFGDLSGMMGKLKETQKKIEETKVRLDSVLIDESYNDNRIKVTVTANGIIRGITIDPALSNHEILEEHLVITLNKALSRANAIKESELANAAKDGLPSIPGLDLFK